MNTPARQGPWTRDDIVEAGLAWADRFDRPPARGEWEITLLRRRIRKAQDQLEELKAREREWVTGGYPGTEPVVRLFGGWDDFLRALGFTPRHGGGRTGRPTLEVEAWHRQEAQAVRELGPVHRSLLRIVDRAVQIDVGELTYQAAKARLTIVELPDRVGELVAAGLVEHVVKVESRYRLTAEGKRELGHPPPHAVEGQDEPTTAVQATRSHWDQPMEAGRGLRVVP